MFRRRLLFVAPFAALLALTACASDDADSATSDTTSDTAGGDTVPADVEADAEVVFDAVDFGYDNLDLSGIGAGDTIRFEMTNRGEQAHEFEVIDPTGEALGEVESMEPGESGSATLRFDSPGVYTFQCILVDAATDQPHTELGMVGTFEVTDG
jgi:plastocyanin